VGKEFQAFVEESQVLLPSPEDPDSNPYPLLVNVLSLAVLYDFTHLPLDFQKIEIRQKKEMRN
jgi:hypothetical protein